MSLPSGAIRLNWIQSSGTQYVNTGITINATTYKRYRFLFDVGYPSIGGSYWLVNGNSGSNVIYYFGLSNTGTIVYGNGTTDVSGSVTATTGRYLVDFNPARGSYKFGSLQNLTGLTFNAPSGSQNFYLFAYNKGNGHDMHTERLYSAKIYDNSALVRDYIPCKLADGTVGLWDDANEQFYGNAGSGVFVAGPASEIVELEYIQSSGTQYVDTGFKPNQDTRVVAEMAYVSHSDATCGLFGVGTTNTWFETYHHQGKYHFRYGSTDYASTTAVSVGQKMRIDLSKGSATYDINGTVINLTPTATATFTSAQTLPIHALNRVGSIAYHSISKTYSFQIYDNGLLVRDYVPAKTIEGEIGLYDRVFGEFYRNAGSGVFTAGPEMEHEGYTELEYVESTGAQYVDTGFVPNQDTRVVMDFDAVSIPNGSTATLFAARGNGSSGGWSVNAFAAFAQNGLASLFDQYASVNASRSVSVNGRHIIDKNKNVTMLDGSEIGSFTYTAFTAAVPLRLLYDNQPGGGDGHPFAGKLYSFQIYDNGTEIRIYIPMLHPSGVPGLWDAANERFYASASGTDLLAGPVRVWVPNAPSNFRRVSSTGTTVTLAWDAAANADGYRLYRDGALVANVTGTQFTDTIETNVTYFYTLIAYNENGDSEAAELSVFVEPPPGPPENFRQTGQSLTTISLAWDAVADADTYYLYRNGTLVGVTDGAVFTDTGLKRGREYTYSLCAVRDFAIGEAAVIEAATQYDLGLITDRTQADVSNKTAKGFYQASDLNRVGDAMNYVAGVFIENGYIVEIAPRTDWTDNEWPTPASMAHYLDCLSVLRGVIAVYRSTPEVPGTMEKLNYKTANEIETILVDIDWLLNHIYAAYRHCGVTICGEGGLIL